MRLRTIVIGSVAAAALAATLSSAAPLPTAPQCPIFPRDNAWNRRIDQLPVVRSSRAIIRSIGAAWAAPGLRLGPLGRLADRDPDHRRRRGSRRRARRVRLRGRARQGPISDPAQRRRSRAAATGPHADRRPRHVPALRAVRALRGDGGALAGRLGRDLGPALEPAAPGRLDVRRRRGAADPAGPRALRRGRARARSSMRCASPSSARGGPTSTRRGTTRATSRPPTFPRWDCASGCGATSTRARSRGRRA